jgi:hypothetical protein
MGINRFYFVVITAFLPLTLRGQILNPLELGGDKCERIDEIIYQPQMHVEDSILYVCTSQGLYSKDLSINGSLWLQAGFEGIPIIDYARMEDDILALCYNDNTCMLLLSHDDGKHFEDVTSDLFGENVDGNNGLLALAQHPNMPNKLIVLSSLSSSYGVFQSSDFGDNWNKVNTTVLEKVGYHPSYSDILYECGQDDSYEASINISYDGGQSWDYHTPYDNGDNFVTRITFNPKDPDKWLAGGLGNVYMTSDNGHSWTTHVFSDVVLKETLWDFISYDNNNEDIVYLFGHTRDYYIMIISTDGGKTWSNVRTEFLKASLYETPNDLKQYYDKLLIYTETDVYELSKTELISLTMSAEGVIYENVGGSMAIYDYYGRRQESNSTDIKQNKGLVIIVSYDDGVVRIEKRFIQ